LLFAFFCLPLAHAADFYVATHGNDSNPGTIGQPFATLNGARAAIRSLSHPLSSSVTVWVRGGRYYLQSPFALSGSQDSGTPSALITYRSYTNEIPYMIGGIVVTGFQAVTDPAILARLTPTAQTNILRADLSAQAITNTGAMVSHGDAFYVYGMKEAAFQAELLFQDRAMTLARWPDSNWLTIASSPAPTTDSFAYTNDRPMLWADPTNVWMEGYWAYDWEDCWTRISSIETNGRVITIPSSLPGANNPPKAGQRYFYFNILEELDSPGEYYIDRNNNVLYFWPPSAITNGACILSTATNLVTAVSVSNVTFSGITFEAARAAPVVIFGGNSNLVTGCTLRAISTSGILVSNSPGTGVSWCNIYDTGERGVQLIGSGDRTNLVSGNNYITYNTISNVGRLCRSYMAPIGATDINPSQNMVGVYIAHNVIHDVPHAAINLQGNDHLIEYNEIYRACTETADMGAIYSGYNWTFRGTVMRYNYFHDINVGGGATDRDGVDAIYLDAAWSGCTIYGNIFCNVDHGIYVNGGRDNIIQNNIFVDCTNYQSGKWQSWAIAVQNTTASFTNAGGPMMLRLATMTYQNTLWSNTYPALAVILANQPEKAMSNVISCNISYNNGEWIDWPLYYGYAKANTIVGNNVTNQEPLFVGYGNRDFRLQTNSPVWALGFQTIPTTGFGPHSPLLPADGLRKIWPP
jgi:parallel beta-helix repeat protein